MNQTRVHVLALLFGLSSCGGDDAFITDNNVCPADEDQVVTDTLDHSNDSQLMLSADADGLARYGQTISSDASLSYWGVRLRLRANPGASGDIVIKVYENGVRFMNGVIDADEVGTDFDYYTARFSKVHSFTEGSSYWLTARADIAVGEQVEWSVGNALDGLLSYDESTETWSNSSEQGAHYLLLPCP